MQETHPSLQMSNVKNTQTQLIISFHVWECVSISDDSSERRWTSRSRWACRWCWRWSRGSCSASCGSRTARLGTATTGTASGSPLSPATPDSPCCSRPLWGQSKQGRLSASRHAWVGLAGGVHNDDNKTMTTTMMTGGGLILGPSAFRCAALKHRFAAGLIPVPASFPYGQNLPGLAKGTWKKPM